MTLKARLLIGMGVVALLLVTASVIVTRTTTTYLVDQVDAQLLRFARADQGGPRLPPVAQDPGLPPDTGGDRFTTLFVGTFADSTLSTRIAPGVAGTRAPVPRLDRADAIRLARTGQPETVGSDIAGTRYRVVAGVDQWSGQLAVVGLLLNDVDAAMGRLVVVELLTSAAVLVVLGLITWWVLHLGVRPVRRMTGAATTIARGDLSGRVPDARAGTEAGELGVALNTMLGRIEHAFNERAASEERLRRFVADASHELRTPITTIRGYAELYRLGGLDERARLDAAMTRTEAESIRMGRLVEDLLTLARLDRDGDQSIEPAPVALDRVVADAVADLRVRHPEHPVTMQASPAMVLGATDPLQQVVANLLTNAAVHTPPRTPVEVTVDHVDLDGSDHVRLVVRDHGPGLDDEAAGRAFERFWRADPSRSRASGGSGLGLSIVAAIVGTLGGTVRLERPTDGTGTEAVVILPAAAPGDR